MARGVMAYTDPMVTVDLVSPGTLHLDQGFAAGSSRGWRRTTRRRTGYGGRRGPPPSAPLATVKVPSSRLRECSPYFGCLLISGTSAWSRSRPATLAKTTFQLEVQTEVKVYEDCFARMHSLHRPIHGFAFCIELLKVATQIDFIAVVDATVRYLVTAPCSKNDLALVCEFCRVPSLEPDEPDSDLARKWELRAQCVMLLLNVLLERAIPIGLKPVRPARRRFTDAFHAVLSGEVCEPVVAFATDLLLGAAKRLLREISDNAKAGYAGQGAVALYALHKFVWLFEAVRGYDAEQALVELLVDEPVLVDLKKGYFMAKTCIGLAAVKKWARMVFRIVEDVIKGKLYLSTAQRVALNRNGRWLLVAMYLTQSERHIENIVSLFLLRLPLEHQEEEWARSLHLSYWEGTY